MKVYITQREKIISVYVKDDSIILEGIVGCSCGKKCEYHTHTKGKMDQGMLQDLVKYTECTVFVLERTIDGMCNPNGEGFTRIYNHISKLLKSDLDFEEIVINVLEVLSKWK